MSILLNKLYIEWFSNPKWWFNCDKSVDIYLTETYKSLIYINYEPLSKEEIIGYILLNDQLIRHFNRINNELNVNIYLQKALYWSKIIQDVNTYIININEWCFIMLPYRHTNTIHNIELVLHKTWSKLCLLNKINYALGSKESKENENNEAMLKRFLKATYNNNNKNLIEYIKKSDILFPNISNFSIFSSILDNIPNGLPVEQKLNEQFNITNIIKQNNNMIISLSGGVDSNVLSYIIARRKAKPDKILEQNIVVVHINYCNRESSNLEEMFVKTWCAYLNIPCYIRRIKEINRPLCMQYNLRELYESYTKHIRFETYKLVWQLCNFDGIPIVYLGHNTDDCFENFLTNISHKNSYNNLEGMMEETNIDNIKFIRPFLKIKKLDIYEFAKEHNIPYLEDSTPKWSQRGKIRDTIVPNINSWDSKFIPNALKLSKHINEIDIFLANT